MPARVGIRGPSTLAVLAAGLLLQAHGAWAFSMTIDASARSYGSEGLPGTPIPGIEYPRQSYYSDLPQPLTTAMDTSMTYLGPVFLGVQGRYEATLEPGAIHLASRSAAAVDSPALTAVTYYHLATEGALQTSLDDEFRITLSGVPQGTPFLFTVVLDVDANYGKFQSGPLWSSGAGIEAAAQSGATYWGLTVGAGSRPAGVPTSVTNDFTFALYQGLVANVNGGLDEFAKYNVFGPQAITLWGRSGVQMTVSLWMTLQTSAVATAGGPGSTGGSADAGVFLDFGNTLAWGGITGVTLVDGTPIALSDLSVESTSGFDYRVAHPSVPEPSAAALLAGSLAALVGLRARSRRP